MLPSDTLRTPSTLPLPSRHRQVDHLVPGPEEIGRQQRVAASSGLWIICPRCARLLVVAAAQLPGSACSRTAVCSPTPGTLHSSSAGASSTPAREPNRSTSSWASSFTSPWGMA